MHFNVSSRCVFQSVVRASTSEMRSVSSSGWRTARWWRATCRSSSSMTRPTTSTKSFSAPSASQSWPSSPTTCCYFASRAWTASACFSPTWVSSAGAISSTTTPWWSTRWPAWRTSACTTWGTSPGEPCGLKRTQSSATWTRWTGPLLWMLGRTMLSMGIRRQRSVAMSARASWRITLFVRVRRSTTSTTTAAGPPTSARKVTWIHFNVR